MILMNAKCAKQTGNHFVILTDVASDSVSLG